MSDTPVTNETLKVPGMSDFVKANPDGRILCSGSCPTSMLSLQGAGTVEGVGHWDTDYVLDGVITPRPVNPATLDGMTLKNLPKPCVITIAGQHYDCEDDTSDLSFSQPGTYTVLVTAFPMLDSSFQVTQT